MVDCELGNGEEQGRAEWEEIEKKGKRNGRHEEGQEEKGEGRQ